MATTTTITSVKTIIVALQPRREHRWVGLTESIGRYVLVRIEDSAGNVGWGEAPALKDWGGEYGRYFGESAAIVEVVVERYLAPAVIGLPVGNIGLAHQRMAQAIKGYPYAKAAVDMACYDLAGRARGVAVHELLGGAVRETVPVTHSIGLMDADAAEREAGQVADEGIRTIKIKVGIDPTRDVEVVRRVRGAVGDRVALCVDANEGYATPGQAIGAIRRMEKFDLIYAEQPVRGIARMAEVARAVDVPITADESIWNAHDVLAQPPKAPAPTTTTSGRLWLIAGAFADGETWPRAGTGKLAAPAAPRPIASIRRRSSSLLLTASSSNGDEATDGPIRSVCRVAAG